MEDLHTLVGELDNKSFKGLRKFLLEYGQRRNKSSRIVELLDVLRKSPDCPSRNVILNSLPEVSGMDQLRVVKSRLKKRLLEYLSHELHVDQPKKHDDFLRAEMRIRRNLIRFIYLIKTRGGTVGEQLMDQIIREAKEYELFSVLREVLVYKRHIRGLVNSPTEFKELKKEADFVSACDEAANKAGDYYYQLVMWEAYHGKNNEKKKRTFLTTAITELNDLAIVTGSKIVLYYLKILELSYFSTSLNYEAGLETCEELLELVQNNKAIYRKVRVSFVGFQRAKLFTYLNKFDDALTLCSELQKTYRLGSLNYVVASELLFHVHYYKGNLDDALKTSQALQKIIGRGSRFRKDQFKFFEACVWFMKKDYSTSLRCLRENLVISKDKEGWGISFRLLRIMNIIELGLVEQAMAEIETVRKHIERYGNDELNKREKVILKLLQKLDKSGFDFTRTDPVMEKNLNLLFSQDPALSWTYFMPEVVRFDQWLLNKMKEVKPLGRNVRGNQNSFAISGKM